MKKVHKKGVGPRESGSAKPNAIVLAGLQLFTQYGYRKTSIDDIAQAAQVAFDNLQPDPQGGEVYTDDRSPVEWVTNSLVINFILSGGVNSMQ